MIEHVLMEFAIMLLPASIGFFVGMRVGYRMRQRGIRWKVR